MADSYCVTGHYKPSDPAYAGLYSKVNVKARSFARWKLVDPRQNPGQRYDIGGTVVVVVVIICLRSVSALVQLTQQRPLAFPTRSVVFTPTAVWITRITL